MPSWWDDEAAASDAGFTEGLLHISRYLGLDFDSLRDQNAEVRLAATGVCKFKKHNSNIDDQKLLLVRAMAFRAASIVASTVKENSVAIPNDALAIRNSILESGSPWVSLASLLDYCWSIGVPVLHIEQFPKGVHKPAGLATKVNNKPVIVLGKNTKFSGLQVFYLAHELAHLALGHVPENGLVLDEKIDRSGSDDAEEQSADAFAVELLNGMKECCYVANGRWPNALSLANSARRVGEQQMVDPGHIVFNYAHSMGQSFYGVAVEASKLLNPNDDATKTIRERTIKNLDWSALPEDTSEFLMRIMKHEKCLR